ncbi:hypothetical protein C0J52_19519 [Blattella germanica]|nr:hypothetical protein C0J52_19519 [Blattella germanica]
MASKEFHKQARRNKRLTSSKEIEECLAENSDNDNEEILEVVNAIPPRAEEDAAVRIEEDDDNVLEAATSFEGKWIKSNIFEPLPPAPPPEDIEEPEITDPITRFFRYVGEDIFKILTECTNRRFLSNTGKSLSCTEVEI